MENEMITFTIEWNEDEIIDAREYERVIVDCSETITAENDFDREIKICRKCEELERPLTVYNEDGTTDLVKLNSDRRAFIEENNPK